MKPAFPFALLALTMTACSSQDESAPVDTEVRADGDPQDVGAGPDGQSLADPTTDGVTRQADAIPAQFLGIWDNVDGNCSSSSDLRMAVRPREIEFYESLGRVANVEVRDARTALVTLDMSGEGETWQTTNRFVLSNNGNTLTPEHVDEADAYEPMPLKKCPDRGGDNA
ncbi:hypothetical protein E3U23_01630 [Erythrobacter litoralis]|uniref:hypothetical protein n=1 Tax=Erythrobacter litoralis TaxID=39960 RepID=UPI002435AEA3|nr:hypothetical protein [Erythrobacter litoralis]MDG6077899.1 hypothetical protein [Erythrobacter litoralis]